MQARPISDPVRDGKEELAVKQSELKDEGVDQGEVAT